MRGSVFVLVLSAVLSAAPAFAQQSIKSDSGSPFMEEVNDTAKPTGWHSVSANERPKGQEVHNADGSLFMEEVPDKKKARSAPRPAVDFSNINVPVDPHGRIIPLLNQGGGPSVMPNFSNLELDYTPPTVYVPYSTFSGPYGYVPRRTPFGIYPAPVYQTQPAGILALPLGLPRTYMSSSEVPESQSTSFQFSGSYTNSGPFFGPPAASIWSPSWRSPWGSQLWLPRTTQFQNQGSIQSFFPNLNQ